MPDEQIPNEEDRPVVKVYRYLSRTIKRQPISGPGPVRKQFRMFMWSAPQESAAGDPRFAELVRRGTGQNDGDPVANGQWAADTATTRYNADLPVAITLQNFGLDNGTPFQGDDDYHITRTTDYEGIFKPYWTDWIIQWSDAYIDRKGPPIDHFAFDTEAAPTGTRENRMQEVAYDILQPLFPDSSISNWYGGRGRSSGHSEVVYGSDVEGVELPKIDQALEDAPPPGVRHTPWIRLPTTWRANPNELNRQTQDETRRLLEGCVNPDDGRNIWEWQCWWDDSILAGGFDQLVEVMDELEAIYG